MLWTLAPLAFYILLSGLDDVLIDTLWAYSWIARRWIGWHGPVAPTEQELAQAPQQRIAIFAPLWHEHAVIEDMLSHNISSIRYGAYDFFVGAYPNDAQTLDAVRRAETRFPNVHLAVCPHDGPTSKADCLNWIYQRMLLFEEAMGVRFDVVMTHDAEDLVHPDSLRWVNYYSRQFGFVQIPVLALPTHPLELTHGVYCDEFAEFQTRDLPVRSNFGGFVPSAGVGTAYSRIGLEALATTALNRIFEPSCLTEDYENGYRLHALGFKQIFVPITRRETFVATREYFPRKMRAAIRQRTRWVTGIALQGWERHGWSPGKRQWYWLWRDRKGLISNPLSVLTNLVCGYALVTQAWNRITPPSFLVRMLSITMFLQLLRMSVRIACATRIYGLTFGIFAPVRAVVGNVINSAAVFGALYRYSRARILGEPLVWLKTEHDYPSREALIIQHRPLGEILTGTGYVEPEDLDAALRSQPPGKRLGEHLIALGMLTESELYEALSLQQHLPLAPVDAEEAPRFVARALPAHVTAKWKVLPFRIDRGRLDVASPELPVDGITSELCKHTTLEIRFHLMTPRSYRALERRAGVHANSISVSSLS